MRITDTFPALLAAYDGPAFSFGRWKEYIDAALPGLSPLLISDVKAVLVTGSFTWERDYLPVLNAVGSDAIRRERVHASFLAVTENLDRAVRERFGRDLDVEIVFYLGLCNGAGWVTEYRGRTAVLLGVEKIMELDWCGIDEMRGLVLHELGHAYQGQYGVLKRTFDRGGDAFLWQLFTEGIAMYFEQELVGDPDYYHQDKDGWKTWCGGHLDVIKRDFARDLAAMTFENQRYFGDWVRYRGRGDVGYYLGCRFVRDILAAGNDFDDVIRFDIDTVRRLFRRFAGGDPLLPYRQSFP